MSVYQWLGKEGWGSYRYENGVFERVHEPAKSVLTPGFVDIHIHGAFGIDFMSATAADMEVLCTRLRRDGYEGFLPTTVTATPGEVLTAIKNLPHNPMILGFHLEGPFISPEYPGAQPEEKIVAPSCDLGPWQGILDDERLKVVTLAPEIPGALELILKLNRQGVIASMGHSNATYEEARRGYEFGAHHTTHTFNAMRPFHHREAGLTGYALDNEELYSELIYDRKHVSYEAAKILIKTKGTERVIAVSDSTAATGLPKGTEISMWGHACTVGDKEVHLKGTNTLAGSGITLLDAFQNLASDFGPELAVRACCHNPRLALRIDTPPLLVCEWSQRWDLLRVCLLAEL